MTRNQRRVIKHLAEITDKGQREVQSMLVELALVLMLAHTRGVVNDLSAMLEQDVDLAKMCKELAIIFERAEVSS